jgi:hypothetical protein
VLPLPRAAVLLELPHAHGQREPYHQGPQPERPGRLTVRRILSGRARLGGPAKPGVLPIVPSRRKRMPHLPLGPCRIAGKPAPEGLQGGPHKVKEQQSVVQGLPRLLTDHHPWRLAS